MIKEKKVFILGMARSGFEAAKLLASDNEVFITDMKDQDENNLKELEDLGVIFKKSDNPIEYLDESYDLMVKNPAIKYDHPTVVKAKELGIDVINEVELGFGYLMPNVNIIGVTGSNGKTTTVTLIYEILKEEGKPVHLGGNIGIPFCKFVSNIKSNDFLVMEISDHQLCDMYKFKTNISVLLNIFDAHTDFHDSHEKYVATKKKIFNNHTDKDYAVINYDNKEAVDMSRDINSQKLYFSKDNKHDVYLEKNSIYYKGEKVISCDDIKLKGIHNYENIMAAIGAVKIYNVSNESICNVLKRFGGVEHRIEYVTTIDNVAYYNDSKSTNCEATKTALNSFKQPTLLIMGGLDRGIPFDELESSMENVKYVASFGETKFQIKEFCDRICVACGVFDDLEKATMACYDKAQDNDVVLLSPACASWDQYDNFELRGNEFKKIVNSLKELDHND